MMLEIDSRGDCYIRSVIQQYVFHYLMFIKGTLTSHQLLKF